MNDGYAYRSVVRASDAGCSALAYLAGRYRHSTEAVWRARLRRGEVRVGDVRLDADRLVRAGDVLVWSRPPWDEADVPLHFDVVHHDPDLLAVSKPAGLPTVPNGGFLTHTLLWLVRRTYPRAVPMHRLGRGTSGLVLFALSPEARRVVAAAWRGGEVSRTYRALVARTPAWDTLRIDTPIGLVPHPRLGRVHAASPAGKAAVSNVRVLARRAETSVVEVHIETGRAHQIRIHLAAAGHVLVGDRLYTVGGVPSPTPALPGDDGYLLHAHRLALRHPATGRDLMFEAPLPPELAV
jgi:23S rRNA pseudouridine1911/1915/1917 synthase